MVRVTTVMPATPVARHHELDCDETKSPSTPHRIELRNDQDGVKSYQPVPKARRRLNNNKSKSGEKNGDENRKITEYFPVRRSARKTKKIVLEEKQRDLEYALRNAIEDGLEVKCFEGKGRGVVAAKDFIRGDFVVEYSGDLIDPIEAKIREEKYAQDQNTGCYMYYFRHNSQQYCVDATTESGRLGRLVNHSRNGNLVTRTILLDNKPRLVLLAKEDIKKGEEILYDYGDRSKESLKYHPWLAY